jgi:hypothetical protein
MYPKELMSNVYWGFYGGKYDSLIRFINEAITYNKGLDNEWNPREIVLNCKELTVQYSWRDGNEDEEIEDDFNLTADNQSDFSAGELLFKIHNQVVEKLENEDHHFFEGLSLWDGKNYSNSDTPLYFLNQGS